MALAKSESNKKKVNRIFSDLKQIYAEGEAAKKDPTKVLGFKGMRVNLGKLFDRLESTWDELVELYESHPTEVPLFPSEDDSKTYESAKRYYYKANSTFIGIEDAEKKAEQEHAASVATSNAASTSSTSMGVPVGRPSLSLEGTSFHLPRLDLPSFDGQILNWPKFRDAYLSMVHEDDNISPVRKFHYLVANVSGPARAIVSRLQLTATNYPIAWKELHDTYDKKRLLASAYLNELLNFKPIPGNKSSVPSLQSFLSKVCENVSAFDQLGIPDKAGYILFHIAIKCVDVQTRELFEISHGNDDFPSFENLTTFVRNRCHALQLADQTYLEVTPPTEKSTNAKSPGNSKSPKGSNKISKTTLLLKEKEEKPNSSSHKSDNKIDCVVCHSNHVLLSCPKFKGSTPKQRWDFLKSWKGCTNCLSYFHTLENCKSKWHCRLCKQRHNTDLHIYSSSDGCASPVNLNSTSPSESHVLLGTVICHVQDIQGQHQPVRMVIDNGSQNSFLTRKCVQRLGLSLKGVPKKITCLGDTMFAGIKGMVSCKISPCSQNDPEFMIEALVVSKITSDLPNFTLHNKEWEPYCDYELADPKFWESRPIEGLLGCDIVPEIWTGGVVSLDNDGPRLFGTIFGHIVMGKIPTETSHQSTSTSTILYCAAQPDIRDELRKFWELEEISKTQNSLSVEEQMAENHFVSTHYRTESGKYGVYLPFKESEPIFGNTYHQAFRRLLNLEDKFRKNPELAQQYKQFMLDYEKLNHMFLTDSESKFILSHHSVTKIDRSKLKLRVVFDGSAQTTLGSLNDKLYTGPKLQTDIKEILMSFRKYPVVFVTDVVKMYRCIEVAPSHRPYQHILWRSDSGDQVRTYELQTLTYGLNCSPFLALRVMAQLKNDHGHEFPLAAEVLCRDMYIDDFPTGAASLECALELQKQLIGLLSKGGFSLSKWASNRVELLNAVSGDSSNTPVSLSTKEPSSIKVLGLQWDPQKDCFSYQIDAPVIVNTKRSIASNVAKIYDPLGFLSPVVLKVKYLLQELWKDELGWDDPIPDVIKTQWSDFVQQLPVLSQIEIPRFLQTDQSFEYQLVGFSDASERAYSASIYIRVLSHDTIYSQLLIGKTKLAPIKFTSIPRLELCGAYLLALTFSSLKKFIDSLPNSSLPPIFFTDSTTVLSWINTPTYKLKTFVANRVEGIIDIIPTSSWRYVKSDENPSDCSSRGVMPNDIIHHSLWWNGPWWLTHSISTWPSHLFDEVHDLPELKCKFDVSHALLTTSPPNNLDWMKKFSSLKRLILFVATIKRFIANHQHPESQKFGPPSVSELEAAEFSVIRAVQFEYFFERNDSNIPKTIEKFVKLSPFIDQRGLLRVGGRLKNSDLQPRQKFPVLLPRQAHFSLILVDFIHDFYFHPGPNLLQALIQLKYWIPSLRKLVKQRIFLCMTCFKLKANKVDYAPKMGDLPACRVTQGRAFQSSGVDFMGPLMMRESLRRKAPSAKVWVCVFVCMRTKALHLEAVSSLSTEAFLASFTRFISRRGLPEEMFSDCGTNFRGAAKQLEELHQWFMEEANQKQIAHFCTVRGINWRFNPPHAPHFGGIWEAGVKSVKTHFKAVAGMATLTFEELSTLLTQIEAILNSRPLCPLSSSPDEIDYLSPGHFLVGGPLIANPEPTLLDVSPNRLSRWQVVKQMNESLWRRWKREYLSTLQERAKWTKTKKNLEEGDLVLLRQKDSPPLTWPLARVVTLHPGSDNTVRVVTVRTNVSVFQRPVVDLVPLLPLMEDPYTNHSQ